MLSPSLSPRTSTTDRGSRIARLFPHFATCMVTSMIYNIYVVYPSRNGRGFQGWDDVGDNVSLREPYCIDRRQCVREADPVIALVLAHPDTTSRAGTPFRR